MKYLLLLILLTSNAFSKELITVKVKGLVCGLCEESLETKFKKNSSVSKVEVNLDAFWIKITSQEANSVKDSEISKILNESGYLLDKVERNTCEKC